ncbi:hypothetical protein TNCV_2251851 [Trichonephila clavipes]|nr:hypothetical protein TNCV_2251851 [Trichonephila clavipes]
MVYPRPVVVQAWPTCFRLVIDQKKKQAKEAPQSDRTIGKMHNATVQQPPTVSPNSKLTIVMLRVEVGFVSKHDVVPSRCSCPPFIAPLTVQTPMVPSQG